MRSSKSGTALVPPLAKRVKIAHTSGSLDDDSDSDSDSGIESASTSASGSGSEVTETEDGIADAKSQKSKKTMKRKHRATEPSRFGATLEFLLATETPSTQPLSLRPSAAKKHNDEWLESKARRALQLEKKDKEDKGRITDVIGGWGGQSERALRKIAQRGVVQLFNAIQQSQAANVAASDDLKVARGNGKPSLPAQSIDPLGKGKNKGKNKDNVIGRGKAAVDKNEFLDLIRSGGIVAKT